MLRSDRALLERRGVGVRGAGDFLGGACLKCPPLVVQEAALADGNRPCFTHSVLNSGAA